jgi:type 1 glutamine amidotransferase
MLLGHPAVQKELKLEADQIKKFQALGDKMRDRFGEIFGLEEPERGKRLQALQKANENALAEILSPEQLKRLKQISYQQQGTAAFNNAETAQLLELTDAQKQYIRKINEELNAAFRKIREQGAPNDDTRKQIDGMRKKAGDSILNELTDAQRAKWRELQGEPFKGQLAFGGGQPQAADPARFLDRITKALPDSAPAKPKEARKLLLYSRTAGFRHPSIPVGVKALTMMGDKTGAYLAYHTEDESIFEPEKLKTFDAVFMLNTTGDCLRPQKLAKEEADKREEELKKSLLDFVNSGKGLAGLHAATDTYHRWKDYNRMIGGRFASHPWTKKVPIKNLEPNHPLTAMFDGKDFEIRDEIYTFFLDTAQPTEQKFLLALDTSKMPDAGKGNRKEAGPYPISWVSTYGKGRTFYCSLGHMEEIYCEPTILKHYLAGIQYVLGDLDVDASPTAKDGKK